jgi:hypothetical protein
VQLARSADSINRANRLLIAGVALAGAGLIAVDPVASTLPNVQHRAVQLTAGEEDWTQVLTTAEDNLTTLESEAATANSDLSTALGNVSEHFGSQISTAFTGAETGLQNSIDGGWYGSDDGYVFGLFGGTVTNPATGISETGSLVQLLSTDFQDGNTQQAFSDVNAWELETLDHTLKPLLSPLLDETSGGATNYSIPVELSQIQTNVLETFGNYNELKAGAESVLSPEISAIFALTKDVDAIGAEFAAGDTTQGMSDLNNLSSDVLGAFVNGYDFGTNPFNGAEELFPGLLNDGSLLQSLLVTWPEQLVAALGESTSTTAAESVSTALPDLFGGLVSF